MTINMDDSGIQDIAGIKRFLRGSGGLKLNGVAQDEKYSWIATALKRFRYFKLRKKEKSLVKTYMRRITGFSDAQMTRLIPEKRNYGKIGLRIGSRHSFARTYTKADIELLAETDNLHERLSGPATKKLFQRAYEVYGDGRFERLREISVAHLYNLRGSKPYKLRCLIISKTRPVKVNIGLRSKPRPCGRPGYLRVDTVHQGDRDKAKGVYHINIVDEVSQWEIIGAVEGISEQFLEPLLGILLALFPFKIFGFHSDNGSEYVNDRVAGMLNKLLIEQTKSRARRTNDNALVEGKNGSIIRKQMGYAHIPCRYAAQVNAFYQEHLNEYLNFHRPCGFATTTVDKRGKEKKVYKTWQTPYERLQSLPEWEKHLKPGVTAENLNVTALRRSDHDYAHLMRVARNKLFAMICRR
jgi:hypothetical protein